MMDSPTPSVSLPDEIRQLQTTVDDILTGLRKQHDLLRVRGMGLPPGTLGSVEAIDALLKKLLAAVTSEERERNQLRALVATSALINTSLELDSVLASAMDEVINLTGAERGYILLRNATTGELEFRIARNLEQKQNGSGSDGGFHVSSTILNEVLATGEPLLTDNAHEDPRMQRSDTIVQFVLRSVLCVPLKYRDKITGAVYVDNRYRTAVFTARERNLLTAFANQIAVAIENARLFASIRATLAEITEMKELMENVFASIGSGVITTDGEDRVTTFNRAAGVILERAPETAIQQPLSSVLPRLSSDFDERLRAVRERNQSSVVEAEPDIGERGRVILSLKLSPLKDDSQQTQGVAMVVDDLTAQREREELINLTRRYLPPGMLENIHDIAGLALGGERREATCMFADVCPLTDFPRDMRPQRVMELLNTYLTAATGCVHDVNGLIDKYMGSEMMVLFNTQLNPQDDHALRAVMSALRLREALVRLHGELQVEGRAHFYRIGIHSGVATLGNVGSLNRRNFTALGDTINLAKRLQENAKPGQIILSEDVLRQIEATGSIPNTVRFEERDPIQVKGRKQLTRIYEVFQS